MRPQREVHRLSYEDLRSRVLPVCRVREEGGGVGTLHW